MNENIIAKGVLKGALYVDLTVIIITVLLVKLKFKCGSIMDLAHLTIHLLLEMVRMKRLH